MKSESFIFILFIFKNFIVNSISIHDNCSGRWQIIDELNIKITLDWQIFPKTNKFITEFRTNLVDEGFWYGFGLSSSSSSNEIESVVYALRRKENDSEIFWDIYNITESEVIVSEQNSSSIVMFQPLSSSGLLTIQPVLNEQRCSHFVYMRGRFSGDIPLLPDEIRFNQSLCLTCQRSESMSTSLPILTDSTIETKQLFIQPETSTMTSVQLPSFNYKREIKLFWFGRILHRVWSNDYYALDSLSSQQLRFELQNFFLFLINTNSSLSFICNQFELYSLESGSILFASNITLISNLSEDQTIDQIENLIKTVNTSKDDQLQFDSSAHHFKRTNEISQIDDLFKQYSSSSSSQIEMSSSKQAQLDSTFHMLIGCIVGVGFLMTLIITILCLYGYYKCRRQQFRHLTEQQTIKFKTDIDSYTWLGQQPSISCSSPYLIQSTSI